MYRKIEKSLTNRRLLHRLGAGRVSLINVTFELNRLKKLTIKNGLKIIDLFR